MLFSRKTWTSRRWCRGSIAPWHEPSLSWYQTIEPLWLVILTAIVRVFIRPDVMLLPWIQSRMSRRLWWLAMIKKSLFPVVNWSKFLGSSSQYMLCDLIPSCFRFENKTFFQLRCTPKYFTSSVRGKKCWLFCVIGGHRLVNITSIDFALFTFIRLFCNQFWILFSTSCEICDVYCSILMYGYYIV